MGYWGATGKYHNVGLSDPGRLPATKSQLDFLKRLDRRDYTGKGLTKDDASNLIEAALERKDKAKSSLTQMEEGVSESMWKMAIQAANKAGDKWMEENTTVQFAYYDKQSNETIPVYGAIGTAWLTWPKKGTALYKWLKEQGFSNKKDVLYLHHRYADRLEGELLATCAKAALKVFSMTSASEGIDLMVRSDCQNPLQAA